MDFWQYVSKLLRKSSSSWSKQVSHMFKRGTKFVVFSNMISILGLYFKVLFVLSASWTNFIVNFIFDIYDPTKLSGDIFLLLSQLFNKEEHQKLLKERKKKERKNQMAKFSPWSKKRIIFFAIEAKDTAESEKKMSKLDWFVESIGLI